MTSFLIINNSYPRIPQQPSKASTNGNNSEVIKSNVPRAPRKYNISSSTILLYNSPLKSQVNTTWKKRKLKKKCSQTNGITNNLVSNLNGTLIPKPPTSNNTNRTLLPKPPTSSKQTSPRKSIAPLSLNATNGFEGFGSGLPESIQSARITGENSTEI